MTRAWLVVCALVVGCGGGRAAFDAGAVTPPPVDAGLPPADAALADAGTPDAVAPPDPSTWAPRELVAERLSRFLWNQPAPDPAIVAAVASATSADDVADVARGMLADARARDGITAFFSWWLRLPDLANQPKDDPDGIFTPDLRAALQLEAPAFANAVILDGDARFETLLTAPYTYMNEVLARHYGVGGVTGTDLRQVPFETPERIGLFGEAAVLARFAANTPASWPPRRFWLVRQTLLCLEGLDSAVPINTTAFVIDPNQPLRQQLETITAPSMCRVCHQYVNPFGYAFIKFNSLGQFWTNGFAGPFDDASGSVPGGLFLAEDLSFDGEPDLMRRLAGRPEAMSCFAWIWLAFAVARPANPEVSGLPFTLRPSLAPLAAEFEAAGGDIRGLLAGIVRTPAFLQATDAVNPDAGATN